MPNNEKTVDETIEEAIEKEATEAAEEPQEEPKQAGEDTASSEAEVEKEAKEEPAASPEDEALSAKYMRLAADFQNFKRRTEKEKTDIYQYANEKIALDIIEVMDNFDRALAHLDEVQDKGFAEGVEKIFKQLSGVLDKNNIIEIAAEGEEFDPNFHNAVMTEEVEGVEAGIITRVMQKGYTLNGKVIRASMVMVAK